MPEGLKIWEGKIWEGEICEGEICEGEFYVGAKNLGGGQVVRAGLRSGGGRAPPCPFASHTPACVNAVTGPLATIFHHLIQSASADYTQQFG